MPNPATVTRSPMLSSRIVSFISIVNVFSVLADYQNCSNLGQSQVICHQDCDWDNGMCWQKTVVESCSCSGLKSHVSETAIFDINSGEQKSLEPGFGFLPKCTSCHKNCSKEAVQRKNVYTLEPKVETTCAPTESDVSIDSRSGGRGDTKSLGKSCPDRGNMTRLCIERCPEDGVTCFTEVQIDACTCGGRRLQFQEVALFDMIKKTRIESAESNSKYVGYSRVCGDCIDFCQYRAGEKNEYHVNEYITTCFDASKMPKS